MTVVIRARTVLCADAEVLASVQVAIQPHEGKQSSIVSVNFPGMHIQSHCMEAGEFADHWQRIADQVRRVADEWDREHGWVDPALDAEQRADAGLDQPRDDAA